jgi:hypothetical protein
MAKKMRPEMAKSEFINKVFVKKSLVTPDEEAALSDIRDKRVLEIGGIGILAEYLSTRGNEVRLCEDDSLYFDYREHVVPTSTVVRLNTSPHNLKSAKPYYDYVIIHSDEYNGVAERMCKGEIINTNKIEEYIEKKKEKKEKGEGNKKNEQIKHDNEVNKSISENVVPQESTGPVNTNYSIYNRDVQEGDGIGLTEYPNS